MTQDREKNRGPRRRSTRSAALVAGVVSVVVHGLLLSLLVFLWGRERPSEGSHRGSYVMVTREPPSPDPPRAEERSPDRFTPRKARPRKAVAPASRPREVRTPPTDEPATLPIDDGAEESSAVHELPADDGTSDGAERSWGPLLGDSSPPSATNPSPECLDQLDNDGDRLIDREDPECWPELPPQELVSKRTGALLLSDIRQDDLPTGDPDELAHRRIKALLRPEGDALVLRDGSFVARIGPHGEVSFESRRAGTDLRFDLDGSRRGPSYLQKKRFLDATADVRADRERRTHDRRMKVALARLGPELNEIWRDRSLSRRQKGRILFDRLDECDLETPGGRKAARIIIDFIRAHYRSRSGAAGAPGPDRG